MQRQDLHLVITPRPRGGVHHQFDVFEETGERIELAHRADELFQVVEPSLRLRAAILLQHVGIARLLEDHLGELGMPHAGGQLVPPHVDLVDEHGQAALRPALYLIGLQHHWRQREQAAPVGARIGLQLGEAGIPHAPFGLVDHAFKRQVIIRRADEAQIGHRIADLGALEEARAADHAVGNPQKNEPLLEGAHLPGRAHQHGAVIMPPAAAHPAFNVVCNQATLRLAVPEAAHLDLGRVRIVRRGAVIADEQGFPEPSLVVRDD